MNAAPDTDYWPFDQPRNCAVITIRGILDGTEPILHVTHDEDDHGWQFLGLRDADPNEAKVMSLAEVVASDSSILQLADLPPGWHAWRRSIADAWTRELNPHDTSTDNDRNA